MSGDVPSGGGSLEERMRRRQEERAKDRDAGGKDEKGHTLSADVDAFDKMFHGTLRQQLSGHVEASDVQAAVDCYREMLSSLQQACRYLPQWDKQRANVALGECMTAINGVKLSGKKRFSFTRDTRPVLLEEKEQEDHTDSTQRDGAEENAARVVDRVDETIHIAPSTSIFIRNLRNCKVLIKPIDGSVFVQDCTDCTFVAAARQLRIHDTHNTSFYLHCVSEPIIESCTSVGFAPFTWDFDTKEQTINSTTLKGTVSQWDKVCTFLESGKNIWLFFFAFFLNAKQTTSSFFVGERLQVASFPAFPKLVQNCGECAVAVSG